MPQLMTSAHQAEKAHQFRQLHEQPGGFIIANPWDAGSARLLEQLGFPALASSSAGLAFSQGLPDRSLSSDAVFEHLCRLAQASRLPISADLESGFAATPEGVAENVRRAAAAGVVGASIEDTDDDSQHRQFSIAVARDRVRAAVEAARALPHDFIVTARAENFFGGNSDLGDTIARLQAYQDAGADVLFAPGLRLRSDIETVLREIDRPLNVLIGSGASELSAKQLFDLGVQRVSVGASLARAAYGEFFRAATELHQHGSCAYARAALPGAWLNERFARGD